MRKSWKPSVAESLGYLYTTSGLPRKGLVRTSNQTRNHYAGPASSVGKGGLAAKHRDLSSILGTQMMEKRTGPHSVPWHKYTHMHTYKICKCHKDTLKTHCPQTSRAQLINPLPQKCHRLKQRLPYPCQLSAHSSHNSQPPEVGTVPLIPIL